MQRSHLHARRRRRRAAAFTVVCALDAAAYERELRAKQPEKRVANCIGHERAPNKHLGQRAHRVRLVAQKLKQASAALERLPPPICART